MNVLTANNVQVWRNNTAVIDKVDLTVNEKEFVGLIGPNGAGKSSLMRVLAGLNKAEAGSVALCIDEKMQAIESIKAELKVRLADFIARGKLLEEQRLRERVQFDIEMLLASGF